MINVYNCENSRYAVYYCNRRADKITIIVTLGIMLDWCTSYFLKIDSQIFTFTKYVVFPLLIYDIFTNTRSYFSTKISAYGIVYSIFFVIGVGGGCLCNTVSWKRFFELIPTVPILLFYLKPRSSMEICNILKLVFLTSLLVPISLILAYLGILEPSRVANYEAVSMSRIWAGTSSSTAGLYLLFPASMIGGLALWRREKPSGLTQSLTAVGIIFLGFMGTLITGQRTSTFIYVIGFIISMLLYNKNNLLQLRKIMTLTVILILGTIPLIPQLQHASEYFIYRTNQLSEDTEASGLDIRLQYYSTLIEDLMTDPQLIAPGSQAFLEKCSGGAHLILGEAYYDGGLFLMVTLFWGIVCAGKNAWRKSQRDRYVQYVPVGGILFSLWFGFFAYLSVDPGLQTRFVYMILGLCLARENMIYRIRKNM